MIIMSTAEILSIKQQTESDIIQKVDSRVKKYFKNFKNIVILIDRKYLL